MTNLLERRRAAVTTQLDVIENTEAYDVAHDDNRVSENEELAERRKLIENWIAFCTLTFELLCAVNREWRQRIFRGVEKLIPGENEAMRTLFERWNRVCNDKQIRRHIEDIERQLKSNHQELKGSEEYWTCCRQVLDILAEWTPPVFSKAVALQEGELSDEDLTRLEALARSGEARLQSEPRKIK